jgi:integrase
MLHIASQNLDTAFICPSTPMFCELIQGLEADTTLTPGRRRDLVSALRRSAKALGRQPEAVPADPIWLQPRIARIVPAALGLTPKSWSNVVSDLRAALAQSGITKRPVNRKEHLAPDWAILWNVILASNDHALCAGLSRFVYFLSRQGVIPEDVRDQHALVFRDALALNEISRAPENALRSTVSTWNLAIKRIPDWPKQRLSCPSRKNVIKVNLDELPASFRADLNRYLSSLETPDPFDIKARLTPVQPATIKAYKARILRFAGALVRSGLPHGEIGGLADLVTPIRVERGLRWMLARNEGQTSVSISETAHLLCGIARTYVRVSEVEQKQVDTLFKRIAVKQQVGMTPKNRARLRPLQDLQTRRRLLTLPEQLFTQAEQMTPGLIAACQTERAVAVAILLYCPIRVKNLAAIHLEKHVQRPGSGRTYLVFEAGEIKNRHPVELELPERVVGLMNRHCATRSPILCKPDNPWLFPARKSSGSMNPNSLSRSVFQTIREKTGLDVNVHLFRHLAAMLYLEARPGEYEAVRRLLGHTQLSRTLNAYAGFEAGTATRLFGDIIDAECQS